MIIKLLWILLIIIIFLFVIYLASKIIAIVITRNLQEISININKQVSENKVSDNKVIENKNGNNQIMENFSNNKKKIFKIDDVDEIESFDNSNKGFKSLDPTVFEDKNSICCLNHDKCKSGKTVICDYGLTNYAHPYDMSPIDKKIFMLNYSENFTIQDYINWLKCFKDNKNELPYNHLKNLNKIENGEQLVYKKGVVPPPVKIQKELTSEEYFNKLYSGNIDIYQPIQSDKNLLGYNYQSYSDFYQNYNQYGSTTSNRLYNMEDIKKKYPVGLVNNYVKSKLDKY